MHSRFLTNTALTILGAFLVVASMAWVPSTFEWLMFGGGIAAMVLATAVALPHRGFLQRGLDGAIAVLGAWTIVASLVFSAGTITWLGFASGIAMFTLAVAGLALHEARTERVVHSIDVRSPEREYATISRN